VSRVIKKPEDLKAASETDKNVAGMGFKLSLDAVRAKYGQGWELAAPVPVVTTTDTKAPASFAEPGHGVDALQQQTDQLAASAAPMVNGLVDQLQLLVDGASSVPDLQRQLVQAYGDLDTKDLVRVMSAALALAELNGMDSAKTPSISQP
jgi:phage gp29-like protein